jgi:hypothetical protein
MFSPAPSKAGTDKGAGSITQIENRVHENEERRMIDAAYATQTGLLINRRDPSAAIM